MASEGKGPQLTESRIEVWDRQVSYIEEEEGNYRVINLDDYLIIDEWICEEDENDVVEESAEYTAAAAPTPTADGTATMETMVREKDPGVSEDDTKVVVEEDGFGFTAAAISTPIADGEATMETRMNDKEPGEIKDETNDVVNKDGVGITAAFISTSTADGTATMETVVREKDPGVSEDDTKVVVRKKDPGVGEDDTKVVVEEGGDGMTAAAISTPNADGTATMETRMKEKVPGESKDETNVVMNKDGAGITAASISTPTTEVTATMETGKSEPPRDNNMDGKSQVDSYLKGRTSGENEAIYWALTVLSDVLKTEDVLNTDEDDTGDRDSRWAEWLKVWKNKNLGGLRDGAKMTVTLEDGNIFTGIGRLVSPAMVFQAEGESKEILIDFSNITQVELSDKERIDTDKEGNNERPANSIQTEDDAEEQSQVDAGKMESRTFLQLLDELQLPK